LAQNWLSGKLDYHFSSLGGGGKHAHFGVAEPVVSVIFDYWLLFLMIKQRAPGQRSYKNNQE
jgi:hypothetical protein